MKKIELHLGGIMKSVSNCIRMVLIICLCTCAVRAGGPRVHKNDLDPAEEEAITAGLKSDDPAAREQAVVKIAKLVEDRPAAVAVPLSRFWCKPLMHQQDYQQVADWSVKTYLARRRPLMQMICVEALFKARIRCWLALGKNDQALMTAKSLYNVVPVRNTRLAAQWLARCLAADPGTAGLVERFESEQAAAAVTTRPSEEQSTVLKSIKVDPTPYLAEIAKEKGENFQSLIRRGHLLLLADKPDEALKAFGAAYQIAGPTHLPQAIENIARAMRDQDGGVGRAVAFLAAHSGRAAAQ